jgi:hypothetical protein
MLKGGPSDLMDQPHAKSSNQVAFSVRLRGSRKQNITGWWCLFFQSWMKRRFSERLVDSPSAKSRVRSFPPSHLPSEESGAHCRGISVFLFFIMEDRRSVANCEAPTQSDALPRNCVTDHKFQFLCPQDLFLTIRISNALHSITPSLLTTHASRAFFHLALYGIFSEAPIITTSISLHV